MKITSQKIQKIEKLDYSGKVYNLELKSIRDQTQDDLFWVANGIVTHNCFVKDINALIHIAESLNVNPTIMKASWQKNLEVRPEKDWENLKGRAISEKNK